MHQVSDERRKLGDECWLMWGRGCDAENDREFNFGRKAEFYADVLQTRLNGRAGFHSRAATKRLLARLDEIQPNVVHMHNLHGYYVNVEMLFDWLVKHEEVQVKWTLHDCWAFTGHCAYFTYVKCAQWRDRCAYFKPCPQLYTYPKTISKTSCAWSFKQKKACFTQLPAERMTLVTPSHWLEGLVQESFLAKYPVEVRHNTVDKSVFKPTPSDFRKRYGIGDRFMILGVASPWTERKGLDDFVRLSGELDPERYAIVLVGLNSNQLKMIPKRIIGLEHTESPEHLAAIYTCADVFFNPTHEDNYPTVNLEAEACGTPVFTYNTGGCKETIRLKDSQIVANLSLAYQSICERREEHDTESSLLDNKGSSTQTAVL